MCERDKQITQTETESFPALPDLINISNITDVIAIHLGHLVNHASGSVAW